MCIVACAFLFKPGEGQQCSCQGLWSSIKRPVQWCKRFRATLCCLEALNKTPERSEGRFHCPLGLAFIESVVVIPRIKMKRPASVLPLQLVSPRKGGFAKTRSKTRETSP